MNSDRNRFGSVPIFLPVRRVSRSARDLIRLGRRHVGLAEQLSTERPLLVLISKGIEPLEAALDAKRRSMIHSNERRLQAYSRAARGWAALWPQVEGEIASLSLLDAHRIVIARAKGSLPFHTEASGLR